MPFLRFLLCLVVLRVGNAGFDNDESLDKLDRFINAALDCWTIPGIMVSVIENGAPVLTKGYGVKDLETRDPVTEHTKFGIASITKHFTALLLATFKQDSRLSQGMDTKVKDIMGPDFAFWDETRTKYGSIRDLLSHKMGIPDYANVWIMGGLTRQEIIRRMHHYKPVAEMRTRYIYNDLMYSLAGHLAEKLDGEKSYEDLITERFFNPLEMTNSTFIQNSMAEWNTTFATPHKAVGNSSVPLSMKELALIGRVSAAGSIVTTASDMSKWQQMLLNSGQANGKQIVPADILADAMSGTYAMWPNTYYARKPNFPVTYSREKYGLGLTTGTYRGYRLITHAGDVFGFNSFLTVVPDKNISIFTSNNGGGGGASTINNLIHMYAQDLLMGYSPWLNETSQCDYPQPWETQSDYSRPNVGISNKTARPVEEYLGIYGSHAFGTCIVEIAKQNNENVLQLTYGVVVFVLMPTIQDDVFIGQPTGQHWYLSAPVIEFKAAESGAMGTETVSFTYSLMEFSKSINGTIVPPPTRPPTCAPMVSIPPSSGASYGGIHYGLIVLLSPLIQIFGC